jgi:hypothetical protein
VRPCFKRKEKEKGKGEGEEKRNEIGGCIGKKDPPGSRSVILAMWAVKVGGSGLSLAGKKCETLSEKQTKAKNIGGMAYFVSVKPCVQTPVPPKTKKKAGRNGVAQLLECPPA